MSVLDTVCAFLSFEPSTKFLKKGASLTGSQFLDGDCWERKKRWPFSRGPFVVFT